jgi:hypothetical protein
MAFSKPVHHNVTMTSLTDMCWCCVIAGSTTPTIPGKRCEAAAAVVLNHTACTMHDTDCLPGRNAALSCVGNDCH